MTRCSTTAAPNIIDGKPALALPQIDRYDEKGFASFCAVGLLTQVKPLTERSSYASRPSQGNPLKLA